MRRGFTLIELLVVITLIGVLTSMGLYSYNGTQGKARDAIRKQDLRDLQKALQQYYQDYSQYPSTGGVWCSSEAGDNAVASGCGGPGNKYIPDVSPNTFEGKYIAKLPRDPKGGTGASNLLAGCASWKRAYLYLSDGVDYRILSHCSPEGPAVSASDPYSANQPYYWQIATKGAKAKWPW